VNGCKITETLQLLTVVFVIVRKGEYFLTSVFTARAYAQGRLTPHYGWEINPHI